MNEAYGEFTEHLDETVFDFMKSGAAVVLRTLAKAYGMAGMRVGWGYCAEPVIAELSKTLGSNGIPVASQAAGAAAVHAQAYIKEACAITARTLDAFAMRMHQFGVPVPASPANFVLLPFPDADTCARVDRSLRHEGVELRTTGAYALPNCLRAGVGMERQMFRVAGFIEGAVV